jgi:hypothetical protein
MPNFAWKVMMSKLMMIFAQMYHMNVSTHLVVLHNAPEANAADKHGIPDPIIAPYVVFVEEISIIIALGTLLNFF